MEVIKTTGTERILAVESIIEDIAGGGTIYQADFKSATDHLREGAMVGVDGNGLYHLCKTAKIVTGGSAAAPRIESEHELVVGDYLSDGVVSLEITVITVGTTYDILTFDTGSLLIYTEGTILFTAAAVDTTGAGVAALATVQDTSGDYLICTVPIGFSPADWNGVSLTIAQAADDVLAVAFDIGVLTISLANSTAANNNLAEINTIVNALGTLEGLNWGNVVFTGTDWDDKQTGATLTTATDAFDSGVNADEIAPKYPPVAVTSSTVDFTFANRGCGIFVRGRVRESIMPYYVSTVLKAYLPLIRFV